jgi:Glycosyl transferase family 2
MSTTTRTMPYGFPHYKPRTMPVTTLRYGGRRRDQQQQRLARGFIADTRATRPTKPLTQGHLAIAAAQISSRSAHGVNAELLTVAPLLSSALAGRSTGAARVGNAPAATVRNPAQRSRNIPVRPANPRVSVVIPTLNEEDNIGWVLRRLPRNVHEIILVDGRSRDHPVAVARRVRPDVRVLEQHVAGKGAALALGLISATGDIVVMIDADGSMDPAEIPGLLGALLSGADVVKGSRESAGGGSHDLSLLRRTGSRA